jgi:cytochrome c
VGGEAPTPDTFAAQVELGGPLYAANCASCHGESGQGTADAPPVVGLNAGALPLDPPATAKHRKTQFKTVADIAEFVVANMPADAPGSLTAEQYWAILAFDLKANGIDLGAQKLDPALAATLEVPRAPQP